MAQYDHHRKAGNQGDVAKHPVLIAALSTLVAQETGRPFHYVDAFAGHGWHPLLKRPDYEWPRGIGSLPQPGQDVDPSVAAWHRWYLARPDLIQGWYPGSATIAADVCRIRNRSFCFHLCDRAPEVLDNLRHWFSPEGLKPGESCTIHEVLAADDDEPAEWTPEFQQAVGDADLLLLDPPGIGIQSSNPSFPRWRELKRVLKNRDGKPTLMWLPGEGTELQWQKRSSVQGTKRCNEVAGIGYHWTLVRWNKNQAGGCQLFYNHAVAEIRAAIDSVAELAGWPSTVSGQATLHSSPLEE